MLTLKITSALIGDENFIYVEHEGVIERIGPLVDDSEHVVVLEPPVLTGGRSPPTRAMKKLSLAQERRNAELIGGRTQPGSGSSNRAKGDVRKQGEYRGESKFTFAKSYSLEMAIMDKIASECGDGEKPMLFLDFKNKTTQKTMGKFVVMYETDFEELLKKNATPDDRRSSERRPR
jgi:hypothetical protein